MEADRGAYEVEQAQAIVVYSTSMAALPSSRKQPMWAQNAVGLQCPLVTCATLHVSRNQNQNLCCQLLRHLIHMQWSSSVWRGKAKLKEVRNEQRKCHNYD